MKICLLTRFFDYRAAGIGRVSRELRDRLLGVLQAILPAAGFEIATMSVTKSDIPSYVKYSLLDCHFKLPQADVYHALTPVEGVYLPRKHSIVTFHDLIMWTHPDKCGAGVGYNPVIRRMAEIYWRWCLYMSRNARVIVCVSDNTKAELKRVLHVPEERIRVIRSGITPDLDYEPMPHARLRLGYLGQLDKRKRLPKLIKAFRWASRLDAELWIGGIGRDEAKLKTLAGDDHRIKFLGLIPDEQLGEFYNGLDWFVWPSWIEGYSLPPVEAMACKVPTVVLADAIIPEEIKSRCMVMPTLYHFMSYLYKPDGDMTVDLEDNYRFAKAHDWIKATEEYIKAYLEALDD